MARRRSRRHRPEPAGLTGPGMTGMPRLPSRSHQRGGTGPDGGRPGADGGPHGADGHVELAGDPGRPRAWTLLAGGAAQSHVDLDDPRYLELEYMRRFGHLIDLAASAGEPLRVLHLGGGGLTLARYVAATRPGSHQLAVEADPEVARLVRRRLPLPPPGGPGPGTGKIIVRVADARAALARIPAGARRGWWRASRSTGSSPGPGRSPTRTPSRPHPRRRRCSRNAAG